MTPEPRAESSSPTWAVVAGGVLVGVAFVALASWSWGKWPDLLVDFGRELYVPWRLVEGDVLYADLAYFNGPFSPYWNALWFRWLGVGLDTLVSVNLVVLGAIAALVFRGLLELSDALTASVATVFFLCVFAFGHLVAYGNYNFVTPYSHDLVHGFALSLLALGCASRAARARAGRWNFAAGAFLGLTFLTKAEVFAAAAAGVAAAEVVRIVATQNRAARSSGLRGLLVGFALPIAGCGLLLSLAMPVALAQRGMLGSWPGIWGGETGALLFYRHWLGVDDVPANVGRMLFEFAGVLVIMLPAAILDRVAVASRTLTWAAAAVVFAVVAGALFAVGPNWMQLGRSLPLLATLWIVFALRRAGHFERGDAEPSGVATARRALALGSAVFALALLAKMLLFSRMFHYGFGLAAPAAVLSVVGLLGWVPAEMRRLGGSGRVVGAAALALIVSAASGYLEISNRRYETKVIPVASGVDAFLARGTGPGALAGRARAVESALERLSELPPDATLLVLPEGVMLNYLARRASPTRYINFLPPELILFGERSIVAALEDRPPDLVILVHKDTREYGFAWFGRDYGRDLMSWVRLHYEPAGPPIGDAPLEPDSRFGIQILAPRHQSTNTGG